MKFIGIAGGSGSGKTTVARTITEKLGTENVDYISLDWYYKDRSDLPREELDNLNMDHPDAFDYHLLRSHLDQLRLGSSIEAPIYEYMSHARSVKTMHLEPRPVTLVEGILILAIEDIRSFFDLRIFVDADADIRFIRRLQRDIDERKSSPEHTIKRYLTTVKPMHEAFVEPSKRFADIIIPRGGQNEYATNMLADLVEHLSKNSSA